mmetsp:Transcript_40488/g.63310  ORF Transcript_40488/g.63310 Transcript_40488/m.63310 type:complete len:449 (-) Transcript_40488:191-1537(-)
MAMIVDTGATTNVIRTCSVKNTFIDVDERKPQCRARRNKSLPPSFKANAFQIASDSSSEDGRNSVSLKSTTFASTTISTDSDSRTEASDDDSYQASVANGWTCIGDSDPIAATYMSEFVGTTCVPCVAIAFPVMDVSYECPLNETAHNENKLNASAAPFKPIFSSSMPVTTLQDTENQSHIREMIVAAKRILEKSSKIKSVEVVEDGDAWSLALVPAVTVRLDNTLELAQSALLEAAENSSNAYVLGYRNPKTAFVRKSHGFECQLCIMAQKRWACWHYFSEGSCKYTDCRKDHPSLQVSLQVNVEITSLSAPMHQVQQFKEEVAKLLITLTTILSNTMGVVSADGFHEDQGCCIEIFIQDTAQKGHILAIAQNAIIELTQISNTVYPVVASTPFFAKPQGFAFILGDRADQSKTCWDHYMYGVCRREHACRWHHPTCLIPVNVIVKV